MRISSRICCVLGSFLIASLFTLSSLFAQETKVIAKTFLDRATEEIPTQTKTISAKQKQKSPSKVNTKAAIERVTEEIPSQPKARFVSSKRYSDQNYNIQLGYFKQKKNVFQLVHKIKKNHNWSVYIKTENKNGTDFYRVLIVDVSSKGAANEIIGQLKSEGLKAILK